MKAFNSILFMLIAVSFLTGCNQYAAVRQSQSGWCLSNDKVEVFVTKNGGHMAPVLFCKDSSKSIQPYYISPWQNEHIEVPHPPDTPLGALRGDFFCMPFGANINPYKGDGTIN